VIKLTKIDRLRDRELIIIKKKIRNQRSSPHKILKLRKMDMNIRMAKKAMVKMMWMKTLNLEHLISVQKFLSQLTYLIRKKAKKKKILLEKTMEKQRLLEELKDTEEGKNMKKEVAWDTMMKRAVGEKVKDDPKKLKKSLKRVEHKKVKSKKEWDNRLKQQKKKQNQAVKRREANIQKKMLRKKGISVPKKSRPGFEGKKN